MAGVREGETEKQKEKGRIEGERKGRTREPCLGHSGIFGSTEAMKGSANFLDGSHKDASCPPPEAHQRHPNSHFRDKSCGFSRMSVLENIQVTLGMRHGEI